MEQIERDVIKIIRFFMPRYGRSEILPEAHLGNDLGVDSLDLIDLSFELEEEFGVIINDDAISIDHSVQEVCDLICCFKSGV